MCVCCLYTKEFMLTITQLSHFSDLAIITVHTYCKQSHIKGRYLIPLVDMLCATLLTHNWSTRSLSAYIVILLLTTKN